MIKTIATWLCFIISAFFAIHWLGFLGLDGNWRRASPVTRDIIMFVLPGGWAVFYALGVWSNWVRSRNFSQIRILIVCGVLFIPATLLGAHMTHFIRSAETTKLARDFTENRLQNLMQIEQTLEAAEAERMRFWEDKPRDDIKRMKWARLAYNRYYHLNQLYRSIILWDDHFKDNNITWPKERCNEFPNVFSEVYDADLHEERLNKLCFQ